MTRIHLALFTPFEDEERNGYTISFPDFPDQTQHTYTRTLQNGYEIAKKELVKIVQEALAAEAELQEPLTVREIDLQPKQVAAYIPIYVDAATDE